MNDAQPANSAAMLDQRIARRVAQFERTLGVVSHSLGATMFPSLPSREEVAENRTWRRVVFATEALVDHVRGEKQALDFARNAADDQLDAMPTDRWREWVWPTIRAALEGAEAVTIEVEGLEPLKPSLTRQLLLLLIAADELAGGPQAMVVLLDVTEPSLELALPESAAALKDQLDGWLAGRHAQSRVQVVIRLDGAD